MSINHRRSAAYRSVSFLPVGGVGGQARHADDQRHAEPSSYSDILPCWKQGQWSLLRYGRCVLGMLYT